MKRLLRALDFAARLLIRWEFWVLWLVPYAIRGILRMVQDADLGVGARVEFPVLGTVSLWGVIWDAKASIVLGATILVLADLAEGRRGPDLRRLRRHVPAALIAAAVVFGVRVGIHATDDRLLFAWSGLPVEHVLLHAIIAVSILVDLFAAWIVFGRIEHEEGRTPPGFGSLLGPGLLVGFLGLVVPYEIVSFLFVPEGDYEALKMVDAAIDYWLELLTLLVLAWFLRFMVLGREERAAAA